MIKHQQILNLICLIRESHSTMIKIFTEGSCFNFYLILRKIYPESIPYYNINHVITKIDGRYYDITGEIKENIVKRDKYSPFFGWYSKDGTRRAVRQMIRYEYKS